MSTSNRSLTSGNDRNDESRKPITNRPGAPSVMANAWIQSTNLFIERTGDYTGPCSRGGRPKGKERKTTMRPSRTCRRPRARAGANGLELDVEVHEIGEAA